MAEDVWRWLLSLSLPMFVGNILFFHLLERWAPAEKAQPLAGSWLNLKISGWYILASSGVAVITAAAIAKAGAALGFGLVDLRVSAGGGLGVQILGGLIAVIVVDFFYYWFHRFQHVIPALWAEHKVHHLDVHLNVTTSLRHHWLEELLRIPFLALPLALLVKLDPAPAGAIGLIFGAWGYFIHANLRLEFGPLTPFIGGPQGHRIHHSRLEPHHDKNFAAFFPVWDILFGTYFHPRKGEFPPTGVDGETLTTAWDAALTPFRVWLAPFSSLAAAATKSRLWPTRGR